jgi:hypothetical protein
MEVDIIVTIALATAVIVIVNQFSRIVRARMLHRTIREALTRDSVLTPELLDRIEEKRPSGYSDDRSGLVLIAIGAAILVFGLVRGPTGDAGDIATIAVFPIFVGAVLAGRHWYRNRSGAVS